MKSTIIAVILLLAVIIFTVINSYEVKKITDELYSMADASELYELKVYWQQSYYYLSLSTHCSYLEDTDKALGDMISYYNSGNYEEYMAARARFVNTVDEIATGEKVRLYNIF